MKRVVVLLSGGLDSTVLATMAERAGILAAAVFVDYGQPARQREAASARLWCGRHRARLAEIQAAVPGVRHLAEGIGKPGPRVVPCRNLILLSLAASVAAEAGARELWYGATAADQPDYPDCRPEFMRALSAVLSHEGALSVHAPLSGMRRSDIVALAIAIGVQRSETWSCYEPRHDGRACGTCNSCRQDEET